MRVLAIDAGKSTGLTVVEFAEDEDPEVLTLWQTSYMLVEAVDFVKDTISYYKPHAIVCEQFDLRPNNKFTADLSTVYLNGAIEYMAADKFAANIVWQTPAQAKGLVSNAILQRLGDKFWPTGKTVRQKDADDARDALRHAVTYGVTKLKHMPTTMKGWPR